MPKGKSKGSKKITSTAGKKNVASEMATSGMKLAKGGKKK